MKSALAYLFPPFLSSLLLFLCACGGSGQSNSQPAHFAIGGTVADLAGTGGGLVLQNNNGDNLTVSANGSFKFASTVTSGGSYSVTVFTQPSNPVQTCSVVAGTGTATGNISNVKVECGHGEWAWIAGSQTINQLGTYGTQGTAAAANTPAGRQYPATWTDSSGDLWLFGGYGHDSNGNLLPMNDLWKFSNGQWTWVGGPTLAGQSGNYGTKGVASADSIPGARFEPASWTDSSGTFWLFGGNGFDSVGHESPMNDLWKYSNGKWTWVAGSSVGLQNGSYGTLGVAAAGNIPGGRSGAMTWIDASGNLWLFGGIGYDETNPINGELNDLWEYGNGQWAWMGGSKIKQQPGVYGTKGVASSSNVPRSRWGACNWIDSSGNLWLFGGNGYDPSGAAQLLNDLWKYSGGQWTWMAGPNVVNQFGVYGTQGTFSADNIPGGRDFGVTWMDASGNVWLFGGNGYAGSGDPGFLNDLWKFSNGQWTWVGGSNTSDQTSSYGTQGTLGLPNIPGGRFFLNRWIDPNGNLWLFGGYGQVPGNTGNLNDLWMYMP